MSSSSGLKRPHAPLTYDTVGVDTGREEGGLQELAKWVTRTFDLNPVRPKLELGYFANVLPLTAELAVAISTDGVGTKLLVAQQLGKFDTVGIDCVAMNANDVICVGARPFSMVDYIAVEEADPHLLGEIGKGLYAGAKAAGITIPGGEIAQVREMIRGTQEGLGFDLVGTCVGTVHPDRLIVGEDIQPGDLVVGIASSGVHSNGLTLARHVLFDRSGLRPSDNVAELGRSIGEELLQPTHIYVKEALQMLDANLTIRALIHITSDGFLNLTRVKAEVGYVIDHLMEEPKIFSLIQERGSVDDAEMFRVYNMGTGFCVVIDPRDADRAVAIASEHGRRAEVIGYAVPDPQRHVWIPQRDLIGRESAFEPASGRTPPPRPS